MRLTPRRHGFTLIELLIVIVIIGILAMIAVSVLWNVKDRGIQATMQADLKTAAAQQELYYALHSRYASSVADLVEFRVSPGIVMTINYGQHDGWAATVTHVSLATGQCGLAMNNAPLSDAEPATQAGVIACTGL